jgi:hypothetical protein
MDTLFWLHQQQNFKICPRKHQSHVLVAPRTKTRVGFQTDDESEDRRRREGPTHEGGSVMRSRKLVAPPPRTTT